MKRNINQQVILKPQDLVVLLKLLAQGTRSLTYSELAKELGMSSSEVHSSVARAHSARLANLHNGKPEVARAAFKEFLLHGAKYAFPAVHGSASRGIPTAYAASPLAAQISQSSELPPVWPHPQGTQRGLSLQPLYPTAPQAALKDAALYEYLALFDALRSGAARERQIASRILSERLA